MNIQGITNIHEDIVKVLVDRLEKNPQRAFISYEDLCNKIGNQVHYRSVAYYLGDISCWCDEIGAPMLSVLVINQNRNRPGKGFFKLYAYLHGLPMKAVDEETVFISEFNELVNYPHWDEVKFRLGI